MVETQDMETGAAGQPSIADFATIITALEGAGFLTKIWQDPAGEVVAPAAEIELFRFDHVRVADLNGLRDLLEHMADLPRSAIIRGVLKPELAPFMVHPRRSRHKPDAPATVDDVARYWCGVDIDDLDVAPWLTPEQIAAIARNLLPYPFSAAPCVWQLSASSGSAKKRAKGHAGVHLWFWLAEPRTSADLRSFFASYPRVDRSLFKAVGHHFTANPILPNGATDPLAGQRIGMLTGFATPSVPAVPAALQRSTLGRDPGAVTADPVAIERLVSVLERSNALRSKTGTVRREARLAFLDVLVNDLGHVGSDEELHELFMRVCVGPHDPDAETDFVEAMSWVDNPSVDRLGVGSLLLEAEGAALATNDIAVLRDVRILKNDRHQEHQPQAADMIAMAKAAGVTMAGVVVPMVKRDASGATGASGFAQAFLDSEGGAALAGLDDEEGAEPEGAGGPGGDVTGAGQSLDIAQLGDPDTEPFEVYEDAGNGVKLRKPFLAMHDDGEIVLKGEINVRRMLKYLRVGVRWNDWLAERQISVDGEPWRKMTDSDWDNALTDSHNGAFQFPVQVGDFERALRSIAQRKAVDPMRSFFEELHNRPAEEVAGHDSGLDLESWFPAICGIEDTPYHRAVGRYMVGAMVRRVLVPGCKSDEMAVLISKVQGKGKSTLCRLLAPTVDGRDTFTDTLALGADPKEVLEQTGGVSIVEFSELAGSRGKEIEHVKAMLSRTKDTARPAYGRETVTRERRFLCIGTTNDETPLRDETGNRRFLPVRLRDDLHIDLDRLAGVREWLWFLAVRELVASGWKETFRLPQTLWETARKAQETAMGMSAAEGLLRDMLGEEPQWGNEWISSLDVSKWRNKFRMADQNFGGAMKRLGFERRRLRVDGVLLWRWERVTEGREGEGRFIYNEDKGTFSRAPLAVVADFKPNG